MHLLYYYVIDKLFLLLCGLLVVERNEFVSFTPTITYYSFVSISRCPKMDANFINEFMQFFLFFQNTLTCFSPY